MAKQIKLTAYDILKEPTLVVPIILGIVMGSIAGSIIGCCGFSSMTTKGEEASTGAALLAIFLFVLGPLVAVGIQYIRYTKAKESYEEHLAFQKRYFTGVDDVLRQTVESEGGWLAGQDWSQWHALYRPKSDEPAVYMAGATMTEQRERVDSVARVGAVKFAKLPFKSLGYANVEKVIEHKVNYDHVEGKGVLIVTHKCLRFVSQGHGNNWSMQWSDVMSWQPAINAILVQPASGTPKAFIIDGAGFHPLNDTQVVNAAFELAHDK